VGEGAFPEIEGGKEVGNCKFLSGRNLAFQNPRRKKRKISAQSTYMIPCRSSTPILSVGGKKIKIYLQKEPQKRSKASSKPTLDRGKGGCTNVCRSEEYGNRSKKMGEAYLRVVRGEEKRGDISFSGEDPGKRLSGRTLILQRGGKKG